jgi:hypothetical protein
MANFTKDRGWDIVILATELIAMFLLVGFLIFLLISKYKQGFVNEHKSQDSMFLFANNKSKPSCCNFSYSSDNGCVCINKEQQMLLHTRGGNRTIDADF